MIMKILENMRFTSFVGGDIDPNELSNPFEGINYLKAYEEAKKNGCRMDE